MTASKLLVFLAACGGDIRVGVDATPTAPPPDTLGVSSGDPPPGSVAITAMMARYIDQPGLVANVPVPHLAVYFQNPDSSVVLATETDARGVAWANVAAGGFVTLIEPHDGTSVTPITTFAGVQPDDRLQVNIRVSGGGDQVVTTLTVPPFLPTPPTVVGSYEVRNSCGDSVSVDATGSGSVAFLDCGGNGLIDVVVIPRDTDGNALQALYAKGVTINQPTATVTGSYAAFVATTLQYTNAPSGINYLGTYHTILTSTGRPYDYSIGAPSGPETPRPISVAIPVPAVPADTTVMTVTDEVPSSPGEFGEQLVYSWRRADAAFDGDLDNQRLPAFTAQPAYSATSHALAWMQSGGKVAPSFVRGQIHAYRDDVPAGHAWTWRIAGPGGATAATAVFPKLPNDGFDYNPTDKDVVVVQELTTAAPPNGYDATLRAQAFEDLAKTVIKAGTAGAMQVQLLYSPSL